MGITNIFTSAFTSAGLGIRYGGGRTAESVGWGIKVLGQTIEAAGEAVEDFGTLQVAKVQAAKQLMEVDGDHSKLGDIGAFFSDMKKKGAKEETAIAAANTLLIHEKVMARKAERAPKPKEEKPLTQEEANLAILFDEFETFKAKKQFADEPEVEEEPEQNDETTEVADEMPIIDLAVDPSVNEQQPKHTRVNPADFYGQN